MSTDDSKNWKVFPYIQVTICLILLFCTSASCFAQFNPAFPNVPGRQDDPVGRHLERLPTDHLALTAFYRARNVLEDGDTTDGLEALQSLLDDSADFFLKQNRNLTGSFHTEVEKLIRENRDDYERLFGSTARQLLEEAVAAKDLEKMSELVRRFRFTEAGHEAIQVLAKLNADHGELAAASRLLTASVERSDSTETQKQTLQQSLRYLELMGEETELEAYLTSLSPEVELESHQLESSAVSNVIPGEGESEFYHWTTPHGGTSQSGKTTFAPAMFSDAWVRPLVDQYDFFLGNRKLEEARLHDAQSMTQAVESRVWSQHQRTAFPAGRALIVDNRVIVPGYASVKSYDLATGEIDGVGVNIDQSFEYLHEFTAAPSLIDRQYPEKVRNLFFSLRGWRDLSSASLSSDGKYVYAVSDCQVTGSVPKEFLSSRPIQRHELLPQSFNQLHAYELKAGLRNRWSIGTVDENVYVPFDDDQELARNIFFYGAPLPVEDHLYIIGEERGQIQIYEIDSETGGILWSLPLLNPKQNINTDDTRRMAGIIPAYIKGLLICPTGEGVITAVDPLTRKVVWSHQYEKSRQLVEYRGMFRRGIPNREESIEQYIKSSLADDRWFDSKIVTAGEYILHTPPDSDELVCLKAINGEQVWDETVFRLRSNYLAGIFEESAILVGGGEISAMKIKDASRIWSTQIPRPSGRGVRMGDRFVQPLKTGEIVIIDLQTGRQLVRSPMTGDRVIGNLTASQGRLIAQSGTEVVAFQSLSEVEQLLVNADTEVEQKTLNGELLLQQGVRTAAMEKLNTINISTLPERGQTVLAWSKLDGLKHEFPQYQNETELIEKLLTNDHQRLVFLKAVATGLKNSGDLQGAFRKYLRLFEELSENKVFRDVDGLHEISEQRFALAELLSLFKSNPQIALQDEITKWLTESKSEKAVLQFLRWFPFDDLNRQLILDRLQNLKTSNTNIASVSSVYEKLRASQNPEIASAANLQLALTSLNLKDGMSATSYLESLAEYGEMVPANQTDSASDLATKVHENPEWSQQFHSVPNWPVSVTESEKNIPFAKASRSQIPVLGPSSVPLKGWTFFLNGMGNELDVYDQHGRRQSRISTGVSGSRFQIGSSLGRYVEVRGHQALVVLADRFLLIDFQIRKDLPRIVANEMLITEDQNPYGTDTFVDHSQAPKVGFRTFRCSAPLGTPAGNVGALHESLLCFGRGSELIAIDPADGQILWKRHDLTLGSEIFSDEKYVMTMEPGQRTLNVYRSVDGTFVKTTEVPEMAIDSVMDRENGDWGRFFPVVKHTPDIFEFSLFDPVHKKTVWKFESDSGTVWTTIDGQEIAFLSSNKKLTIREGLSGQEIVSKTIPVTSEVQSLTVLSYPNQWIVFPGQGTPSNYEFSYPSLISKLIEETVNGSVVAINQTTKEVEWSREVTDQKMTTQAPTRWPILFFGNGAGLAVNGLILNRLTGEVVVEDQWQFDRSWIHWQATIQPMRILIGYGRKTVTLDCTEELTEAPQPPEEDKQSDAPMQSE